MRMMNRWQLFKLFRQHRRLSEKRSVNFDQNRVAKFVIGFTVAFVLIYLVFLAILFALIANESREMTSVEFFCGIGPFLLCFDFFVRFIMQQTPSQMVRPYVLLPLPRNACINSFVLSSIISSGNFIWFALLVPYALMSVVFSYGLWATLLLFLYFAFLFMANSQWYAIVRTLINDSLAYWLLPVAVYGLAAIPSFIGGGWEIERVFDFFSTFGTPLAQGNPLPVLFAGLLLGGLAWVNQRVQIAHVKRELSRTEKPKVHKVTQFTFLERYGELGQYLQLEIKSVLRNKNPRKSFIFSTAIVVALSLIISFTDVYDSQFMSQFWCIYIFCIYGAMLLLRVMCYEGNYLDFLMTRKENILLLLRSKYLLYSALLVLPFILSLPTILTHKWSLLMVVAYMAFTAGFQYFVLFQMAVYNKKTLALNEKMISKNGMESNYIQLVAELINFALPIVLISVLQLVVSEDAAYCIILFIGLAFILTHKLWLRNIYKRFMQRRYENMEAFRASR